MNLHLIRYTMSTMRPLQQFLVLVWCSWAPQFSTGDLTLRYIQPLSIYFWNIKISN